MANLLVRDLMTRRVYAAHPHDTLAVVHDLMDEKQIRHVPVVDSDQTVVGLVSQRDLLRSAVSDRADLPISVQMEILRQARVEDVMIRDVETVEADVDIQTAGRIMLDNKYGCLPVVEGGRLVGILTESDFVRFVTGGP